MIVILDNDSRIRYNCDKYSDCNFGWCFNQCYFDEPYVVLDSKKDDGGMLAIATPTCNSFYPHDDFKCFPELVDEKAMEYYGVKKFSRNTAKKIGWAMTVFSQWKAYCNFQARKRPELNLSVIMKELHEMYKR